MRSLIVVVVGAALGACGSPKPQGVASDAPQAQGSPDAEDPADAGPPDACVGLECAKVDCSGQPGLGTTRLSGTVYAPNGTLPLYNVNVYVPNADPGPLVAGVTCDRCNAALPGQPVVKTKTDELGHFALDDVPVSPDLPLIIQVGKWRRQITVATVTACADNPLDKEQTRLPKNHTEGDMPQIAISTGGCDAIECLVHKLGVDDAEFTNGNGAGKVHLFQGTGGVGKFAPGFANQGPITPSTTWWSSLPQLKKYDIVMFGCECGQNESTKPPRALQAVYDYANLGGRVFMSHWQNYWMEQAPQPWPKIAAFDNNDDTPSSAKATVNQTIDQGKSMYKWLDGPEVKALDAQKLLDISDPRDTVTSVDETKGTRLVYLDPANSTIGGGVQDFQFTVPNDKAEMDRCGKVVFSDMHVSADSSPGSDFPSGCEPGGLSPQEKALAFIFFDIASCVGPVVN
jgi:hypothetical protein